MSTDRWILSSDRISAPYRHARLCEVLEFTFAPYEQPRYDLMIASVRAALGDVAFAAAWAEGRAMSLEQAIAYALEPAATFP